MTKNNYFVLAAAAVVVFAACAGHAPANNANDAHAAEVTAPGVPTKDALVTLEKSAYEAWKSRNAKFWDTFLWHKFVGYGSYGKIDKKMAIKEYAGADCEIKRYALSDEQMRPLGNDAALMTYKTTIDGTCGGQKVPVHSWAASAYVRDGNQWKMAFHAEAAIIDPKEASANPIDMNEAPKKDDVKPVNRDARIDAMLVAEKAVWEAWKDHDAKRLEELTARDISFINIFGTYFAAKADALENWKGAGCDAKSVSVSDAAGTMLSSTVGILTFKGAADGTCYGQKVGPIWGTSVYVMHGDAWKWTFGINVPSRIAP